MASIFGHAVVGLTITKLFDKKDKKLLLLAVVSSFLPDIDVLAFNFGIPYSHPLGHRGFTHSIIFAILWALLLTLIFGRKSKLKWFFVIFLSTISHGILDAMTSGGKGVGFFIPFNNERMFFPFREIVVSPLGVESFFSEWGLQVVLSEFKYIFIPCIIIFMVRFLFQKKNVN
jgi:inner membrane protein